MFIEFNFIRASEEEKEVIFENLVIKHLTAEELEKLADAEQTIADTPRLKRELVDEILARVWEPEKPTELLALLKQGLAKGSEISRDQANEVALKMGYEDIERFKNLAERFGEAHVARSEILELGADRLGPIEGRTT
jgi:hypothetical protein